MTGMGEPEPLSVSLVGSYGIGEAVEDCELPTLSGGTWRLSEARGRRVLSPRCGRQGRLPRSLNMERFDAKAVHVRAFLDRFLEGAAA